MHVSLNQSTFPHLSTARFLEVAAIAGAESVALHPLAGTESLETIAAAVRAGGIPVTAVNALMNWALPDDAAPPEAFDLLLDVATAVASPLLVCVAPLRVGGLPPHADIMRSATERLGALASVAREAGVRLALEQVGRSSTTPDADSGIRRFGDALAIADGIADDVGLVADSYNLATAGETFDIIRTVPPSRLAIAHLADRDAGHTHRVLPGRGDLNIDTFVRALSDSGYAGPLSLELFPPAPWPDPLAFARTAVTTVKRYMRS